MQKIKKKKTTLNTRPQNVTHKRSRYTVFETRFVHTAHGYKNTGIVLGVNGGRVCAGKRTYVCLVRGEGVRAVVEQFDRVSGLVQQRRLDAELFFQEMRYALVQLRGVAGHQVGDQSQRRRFHGSRSAVAGVGDDRQ